MMEDPIVARNVKSPSEKFILDCKAFAASGGLTQVGGTPGQLRLRFSKSLARRRQRLSHAKVRSTTQRIGSTTKPLAWSERFTISTERCGRTFATASANCGPW